jgi:hypothetical protein
MQIAFSASMFGSPVKSTGRSPGEHHAARYRRNKISETTMKVYAA